VKKATGKPRWQAARPSARQRLAGAGITQSNNIVAGDEICAAREFENERLVERWNGGEVERVETFHRREMRGADAPLDHAPFAIDEFELGETQKEADMIETFARGLRGDFFIFAQEGRQLELPQMMGEQNLRRRRAGNRSRRCHAALPDTRAI
jgi:hypothetical protein